MVGNATDAARALARELPSLAYGSTRDVYLIDDVVYKVNNGEDNSFDWNALEFERMTDPKIVRPKGVFFPNVSLFNIDGHNVIAMDYIEGTAVAECFCVSGVEECLPDCMPEWIIGLVSGILDDIGGFNVIDSVNGVFIIDMA